MFLCGFLSSSQRSFPKENCLWEIRRTGELLNKDALQLCRLVLENGVGGQGSSGHRAQRPALVSFEMKNHQLYRILMLCVLLTPPPPTL